MKRLIFIFFVVFSLLLGGCTADNQNAQIVVPPSSEIVDGEQEQEKPDEKKKAYLVSKVDGLRVRSSANSNSKILGHLDKNDAVLLLGIENGFYKTVYKEKQAYVHSSYCTIKEIDLGIDAVERAIDIGASLIGHPYVWGSQRYHWGNGILNKNFVKGEFDCSALVQYVYYNASGVLLDVTSRAQVKNGVEVDRSDLRRGDVMFFTNASRKDKKGDERIGHVGIYFGDNYILHTASDHAVIEPISALRWSYYITARRVV